MPKFDPYQHEATDKLQNYNNKLYQDLNRALSREASLIAKLAKQKEEIEYLNKALNGGLHDNHC